MGVGGRRRKGHGVIWFQKEEKREGRNGVMFFPFYISLGLTLTSRGPPPSSTSLVLPRAAPGETESDFVCAERGLGLVGGGSVVFMFQRAVGDLFVRSVAHFPAHLATLGSKGAHTALLCLCRGEHEPRGDAYGDEHRERVGELSPELFRETALIGKQVAQRS